MRVTETNIPGLLVIEPRVHKDSRGFFLESYKRSEFEALGLCYDFIQDNHACSTTLGVLRGLHFQLPPAAQTKLVRVIRGSVYDVAVDLRRGSPTYGAWFGIELSAVNFKQLLVPKGFAHGYQCLVLDTEFEYKVDAPYQPELDRGITWNDPDLSIPWPIAEPVLSDKDKAWPRLKDFPSPYTFG